MYYRVIGKEAKYTDTNGNERTAKTGQIISLDRRKDSKRLLKEKAIRREEDIPRDKNNNLDPDAATPDDSFSEDPTTEKDDNEVVNTIIVGDLVQRKADGDDGEFGEVVQVYKNGKIKIRFGEDERTDTLEIEQVSAI